MDVRENDVIQTFWFCVDIVDAQGDFRSSCVNDENCAITPESNGRYIQINGNVSKNKQIGSIAKEIINAICDEYRDPAEIEATLDTMEFFRLWAKLDEESRVELMIHAMSLKNRMQGADVLPFPGVKGEE